MTDTKDVSFSRNPHDHLSAMPKWVGMITFLLTIRQALFSELSQMLYHLMLQTTHWGLYKYHLQFICEEMELMGTR